MVNRGAVLGRTTVLNSEWTYSIVCDFSGTVLRANIEIRMMCSNLERMSLNSLLAQQRI